MKVFQVRYRKDEWVTVNVSFSDDVNIDDLDHEQLAINAAICRELDDYASSEDEMISEYSIEIDELSSDDMPEIIICADGTILDRNEYESLLTIKSAN
jgi:hypothetical protein